MSDLKLVSFDYGTHQLRAVEMNGEPFFLAKDICNSLDLSDTNKALIKVDDDEKLTQTLFVSGQNRKVWLVNESGLYSLIFKSRKPEARIFQKWVTKEVLPEIRKTGGYQKKINFQSVSSISLNGLKYYDFKELFAVSGFRMVQDWKIRKLKSTYPGALVTFEDCHYMTKEAFEILANRKRAALTLSQTVQYQTYLSSPKTK